MSESELATQRMADTLAAVSNRNEVLARFVGTLPKRDLAALRRLLDQPGRER